MNERAPGFYWVKVDDGRPGTPTWEPASWRKGCWVTMDGPTSLVTIVAVGDRIPEPPTNMDFQVVREQ